MEQRRDTTAPPSQTRPDDQQDFTHLERAVAGACLLGTTAAAEVLALIGPGDLLDEELGRVLAAASELLAAQVSPDPLAVRAQLNAQGRAADPVLLSELYRDVPTAGNARPYARALLESIWRRRVHAAGVRLQQAAARSSNVDLNDIIVGELQAIDATRRRWIAAGAAQ